MSGKRHLWRWRSNPLRRREDVLEAWMMLAVWAVVVLVGAVVAPLAFHAAEHRFAQQRAVRHPVRAVLTTDAPQGVTARWSPDGRVRDTVRWVAPDGTSRTGDTLVDPGLPRGTTVHLWQDDRGRLVTTAPTDRAEGHVEAGLLAAGAAVAAAAPVLGAGAFARARLDRRRLALWDREWDLVGPR
ncbi:hypothetical protein [Streptomyces malaysiense]|uniref:Proline rich protein membrane protein n=1 Tax=Streptomyces malaysiense TaxID=1428626 RepID=A0A1J4Q5R9_9ACTN|nr:hypothetical protein [Streptomyces malaysiense]OIK28337.1 hypothetical protein VT52_006665 [Streptomyces malaysiense]